MDEINYGFIVVSVRTARGAIPIEGAMVTVTSGDEVISIEFTNSSGMTPKLTVKTPPRKNSESPGLDTPYSSYTIRTDKVGYFSVCDINTEVYTGITSIQPVKLIPLPEE